MIASTTIAKRVQTPADLLMIPTLAVRGLNPKARLLLLCARIGYSPHASFQR